MGRVKGGLFEGVLDVNKRFPLDSRMLVTKREDLINPRIWITNTLTTEATYNGMIVAVNSDGEYNGVYYLTDRKAITDDNYSAYQSALAAEEDVNSYFSMWKKLGTLDDLAEIEADLRGQIGVVPEGKTLIEMVAALESVGAEKNLIALIDETQFAIDENRKLTLLDIAENKITGLTNAAGEAVTLKSLLDSKVDVVNGMGLSSNDFTNSLLDKLTNIESGAQANVLEVVKMAGVALNVIDKSVDIPVATNTLLGIVMGSNAENKVSVVEDGTMEVNSINVNKLTQTDGDELILNGGSSTK
jgi:hypothetical protein